MKCRAESAFPKNEAMLGVVIVNYRSNALTSRFVREELPNIGIPHVVVIVVGFEQAEGGVQECKVEVLAFQRLPGFLRVVSGVISDENGTAVSGKEIDQRLNVVVLGRQRKNVQVTIRDCVSSGQADIVDVHLVERTHAFVLECPSLQGDERGFAGEEFQARVVHRPAGTTVAQQFGVDVVAVAMRMEDALQAMEFYPVGYRLPVGIRPEVHDGVVVNEIRGPSSQVARVLRGACPSAGLAVAEGAGEPVGGAGTKDFDAKGHCLCLQD